MKAKANKIKSGIKGVFPVPGDKSISHRALMFSALAEGVTEIYGLLESEDVLCTMKALQDMGIDIKKQEGFYRVVGGELQQPENPLYMGNSGTSARLLLGVISGHDIRASITGDESLSKRPMKRVTEPLSMMGGVFEQEKAETSLPLWVTGLKEPNAISYDMPVASAQLKSAIMLAGLNAYSDVRVTEPHKSRDHTEKMLKVFGVNVSYFTNNDGRNEVILKAPVKLVSPKRLDVPADPSSAAFMAVAATIYPDSNIVLPNVCMNKTRTGIYDVLIDMGASISFQNKRMFGGEEVADIHVKYTDKLKAINVPASKVPSMVDEYPILAVAAAMADGVSVMKGLDELRVKESNRLEKICTGLNQCGLRAEIDGDDLIVHGGEKPIGGATIETGFDHRIAMSFLILGGVTKKSVTIDNADGIATSFPSFINDMNSAGANIGLLT